MRVPNSYAVSETLLAPTCVTSHLVEAPTGTSTAYRHTVRVAHSSTNFHGQLTTVPRLCRAGNGVQHQGGRLLGHSRETGCSLACIQAMPSNGGVTAGRHSSLPNTAFRQVLIPSASTITCPEACELYLSLSHSHLAVNCRISWIDVSNLMRLDCASRNHGCTWHTLSTPKITVAPGTRSARQRSPLHLAHTQHVAPGTSCTWHTLSTPPCRHAAPVPAVTVRSAQPTTLKRTAT